MAFVVSTARAWPLLPVDRAHLNSPVNTYYQTRPVITIAPSLVTRHWGRGVDTSSKTCRRTACDTMDHAKAPRNHFKTHHVRITPLKVHTSTDSTAITPSILPRVPLPSLTMPYHLKYLTRKRMLCFTSVEPDTKRCACAVDGWISA